jgi:hypothetical protein
MTTEEKPKHETFTLPVKDYPYDRLSSYAQRIVTLFKDPVIQQSDEMKSALDELLGSIYSLVTAKKLKYEDRIKTKKEDRVILDVAKELSEGTVRTDGKWVAGYFMNSGTYRTASVYHRVLKITTGKDLDDLKRLVPIAAAAYKTWTSGKQWPRTELDRVRLEANSLKHDGQSLYPGRTLWHQHGILGIGQILTFIEAWLAHQKKNGPAT